MVARVDNNGDVQAINPGSTVITAEAGGKTGTCEVTVTDEIPVESIAFNPDNIEMNVGEKRQLTVVFTPSNATNKTINVWTVDGGNPNVTVDNNGVVTAVSKGNAVVIAAINPQLIARCNIKIVDPNNPDIPVQSITLDKTEATVYTKQEEPLILTATVTPAEALNGKSIQWKSDDPNTVMVQAIDATRAKVTGVKAGKTTVSAHLGDKSASCEVTVQAPPTVDVESVTLDKTSLELEEGQTYQLTATVLPGNATDKAVTWSSSDNSVAYVSNGSEAGGADGSVGSPAGTVVALKAGNATITASCGGKSATCALVVTAKPVVEAVDLGLPSGIKWRGWNVGASKPEEYGDYYAWGETSTKADYGWSTYKWGKSSSATFTRYGEDRKTQFSDYDYADDAARAVLGDGWRTPTSAEWTELLTNCSWAWTTSNGVKGMRVTGKNGNSIFLPAAGYKGERGLTNAGSYGDYWSSTLYGGNLSYSVDFYASGHEKGSNTRNCGLTVRPVKD